MREKNANANNTSEKSHLSDSPLLGDCNHFTSLKLFQVKREFCWNFLLWPLDKPNMKSMARRGIFMFKKVHILLRAFRFYFCVKCYICEPLNGNIGAGFNQHLDFFLWRHSLWPFWSVIVHNVKIPLNTYLNEIFRAELMYS